MSGVAAREPDFSEARELERDLRARIAGADDEHRAIGQVERIAVFARVELVDVRRETRRERRDRGRWNGPVATMTLSASSSRLLSVDSENIPLADSSDGSHARVEPNGQIETLSVAFEVVAPPCPCRPSAPVARGKAFRAVRCSAPA